MLEEIINMTLLGWSRVREDDDQLSTTAINDLSPPRTSIAAIESLALPLVHEVVFLADFRCVKCQERVAEVMSKMNGETQSVVISVLDKKVTLTCTNTNGAKTTRKQQLASIHKNSRSNISLLGRLLRSYCI